MQKWNLDQKWVCISFVAQSKICIEVLDIKKIVHSSQRFKVDKMAGPLYSLQFIVSMLFCNAFQISVKSDVWSLGCILYCMVYGHTPFQKVVRQYAKLMAIINPEYQINFPEIQDKKLLDVMKVCYSFCFVDWMTFSNNKYDYFIIPHQTIIKFN